MYYLSALCNIINSLLPLFGNSPPLLFTVYFYCQCPLASCVLRSTTVRMFPSQVVCIHRHTQCGSVTPPAPSLQDLTAAAYSASFETRKRELLGQHWIR